MAFETADELAGFFSAEMDAIAAAWTPSGGGSAVPCSIIFDAGIDTAGVGFGGISDNNRRLVVRLSEVADPTGGNFTINAADYRVTQADLDATQQVWTCFLNPTT